MGQTVLLVNGDADTRSILHALLQHEGYTVLEALDADEADDVLGTFQVGLVISELYVPSGRGAVLAADLKRHAASATRVLILTTRPFDTDRVLARSAGADAYLMKPAELADVMVQVHDLIGTARRPAQPSAAGELRA